MKLDLRVDAKAVLGRMDKLPDAVRAELKAETNTIAMAIRDGAKQKLTEFFQMRTGERLKSIRKMVRSNKTDVVGTVISKDFRLHILEVGAKAHDIRPKNAKALALGGVRFAEAIIHPGFRGHTIINAAFQEKKGEIPDRLTAAMQRGLDASDT